MQRILCPFLALVAALMTAGTAAREEPLRLASGRPDGMYWRVAAGLPRTAGSEIEAVETRGSVANLELLEKGKAHFALAQQDVVSDYFGNHPQTRVRVVGRVFFDYLHILLRDPVRVRSVGDLGRLRMWVGEPGSGTLLTASRFLDRLGTPVSLLEGRALTQADRDGESVLDMLPRWFREGRIDVAMVVTTPGLPRICELMSSEKVYLQPLDPRTLRELTEEEETTFRRQTAIGRIPAGTYSNQRGPVATIAVPVLLLTRQDDGGKGVEQAAALLRAARRTWRELALASTRDDDGCTIPGDTPDVAPLGESGLAMLSGLTEPEPLVPELAAWGKAALLLGLLALLAWWARRSGRWEQVRGLWRQDRLPFVLVLLLAVGILAVTVTTYAVERGINENFSSVPESFWSITVYLFSGLEDRTPYTATGRVVATLGLLLGPAFFAVMSGWLARFFIRRDRHMPHHLNDHHLILNWNDRAGQVLRELHHPIIREREGVSVVVVLTDDETLELRRLKQAGSGRDEAFEDCYLSVGDPSDERALRNANAQDACSILILTDDRHGDERTLRSIVMLQKIARETGRTNLHVVAEISNPANCAVLDEVARDFPGLLERISGLQLRTLLLSQAARNAGIIGFYTDLLQISADSNEMYTVQVPEQAVGLSFRAFAALILAQDGPEPLVPVGVQRMVAGRWQILTNPRRQDPGWLLEAGDNLLVIGYRPPLAGCLPEPAAA